MGIVKMGIYLGDHPVRCSMNTDISLFCKKNNTGFTKSRLVLVRYLHYYYLLGNHPFPVCMC